jgi:protein-S-isoprenylcysteine O-methyltransferase Ste14
MGALVVAFSVSCARMRTLLVHALDMGLVDRQPERQLHVTAPKDTLSRSAKLLDVCERAFVLTMLGGFAYRMLSHYSLTANIADVLLVISEVLTVVFIMLRAPSATLSRRPTDWLFALSGSSIPLLVAPAFVHPIALPSVIFTIMVVGLSIQISAKIVLGRSFGMVAANRGVKVAGPYRFVRHPMYLGYEIGHVGFLLAMPTLTNAVLYTLGLSIQIIRIFREENVLKQDPAYRAFADRVHYRLLPGVF